MINKLKLVYFVITTLAFFGFCLHSVSNTYAQSSSFSFGASGDLGSTSNTNTSASLNTLPTSGTNFFLGLGDMSYMDPGTETQWCNYVKSKVGATYPFMIVSGNHDEGINGLIDNFADCLPSQLSNIVIGSSPSGTSPSYTSEYGKEYYFNYPATNPLARFIMVPADLAFSDSGDYQYTLGNSHYQWLASAIDSARTDGIKWVIVGMHKNCITAGVKSCEIGSGLMNLLISKKVDLVLQGHEHDYQRSKQLTCASVNAYDSSCVADDGSDNAYTKGAGTIFTIIGTFGAGQVNINTGDAEAPYFAKFEGANMSQTYGFMKYTVTANQISGQFVRSTGGTFTDTYTITEGVTTTPTPTSTATAVPTSTALPTATACSVTIPSNSGISTSSVTIATTGNYTFWGRMMAGGDTSDSYYLQIDDNCPIIMGDINGTAANTWLWQNYPNINLTAGNHNIKIAGKESGVKIDEFLFLDTTCTPTGFGTNCSLSGDANGDNIVDNLDYDIWLSHYTESISGVNNGDFNGDSVVDGIDYVIWLVNFGK